MTNFRFIIALNFLVLVIIGLMHFFVWITNNSFPLVMYLICPVLITLITLLGILLTPILNRIAGFKD